MKVLLAEDSEGMRKIIGAMLHNMGFEDVVTAENGEDALELLARGGFDLLLTNWNMPVMDGLQLVGRVRAGSESKQLPIVMFTSRASRQDVMTAMQAGVDGYVAKPFTPGQLREQIDSVLRRRAQRQIQRVTSGMDRLRGEDTHPILVVGDAAVLPADLALTKNRHVLSFLDDTATAVGRLAGGTDPPHLGMVADSDSSGLIRLLRHAGDRAKALLLSTTVGGSGLTLARLASVNKRSDLSVFLVCDARSEVPPKARLGLERLDVEVYERSQLDAGALQQLVTEHVLAAGAVERPSELPAPEEIRARLEADIRTTVTLPVMPRVFHDIAELSRDPDSEIQSWVDAIEGDPLSSAQIVRRARSPAYGFRGEVREAAKAVILLGKTAVKELVVSEAVQRAFQEVQESQFDIEAFWLHSVSVAITARLFTLPLDPSQRTAEQEQEFEQYELSELAVAALERLNLSAGLELSGLQDPFVGGMMHDIGKVALVRSYPGLYPAVLAELERNHWQVPMRFAEETIAGGADHTAVGAILAESWRLGDEISEVIEHHHTPSPDAHFPSLVALADLLVGGIHPYPKDADYPLVRLLGEEAPEASAAVAEEALAAFLPTDLCDALGLSTDKLVELGRVLAPSVRKRAEDLRKSL